jgi:DNA-binding response OmpR family regulator
MGVVSTPLEAQGRSRILLVDDDEKFARLLRDYLEPFGYQVEVAHDGRSGLAMALGERMRPSSWT